MLSRNILEDTKKWWHSQNAELDFKKYYNTINTQNYTMINKKIQIRLLVYKYIMLHRWKLNLIVKPFKHKDCLYAQMLKYVHIFDDFIRWSFFFLMDNFNL